MSIEPPNRWFNWVVWVTGGRDGLLGSFYVPTLQEEADTQFYQLQRRRTELEFDTEDAHARLAASEKRVRKLFTENKQQQARAEAHRIHGLQLQLRRLAVEQRLIENELSAVGQVRAGNVVQESVLFRARALRERFENVSPQHLERILATMERLQSFDAMTQESIDDMYRDQDERLAEQFRTADERDADDVESILESLGLVAAVEQAPSVPLVPPGQEVE